MSDHDPHPRRLPRDQGRGLGRHLVFVLCVRVCVGGVFVCVCARVFISLMCMFECMSIHLREHVGK